MIRVKTKLQQPRQSQAPVVSRGVLHYIHSFHDKSLSIRPLFQPWLPWLLFSGFMKCIQVPAKLAIYCDRKVEYTKVLVKTLGDLYTGYHQLSHIQLPPTSECSCSLHPPFWMSSTWKSTGAYYEHVTVTGYHKASIQRGLKEALNI